jgi:hypothetical protein
MKIHTSRHGCKDIRSCSVLDSPSEWERVGKGRSGGRSIPEISRLLLAYEPDSLKLNGMKKETRLRIIIILALVAGYILVAIIRSGTAW